MDELTASNNEKERLARLIRVCRTNEQVFDRAAKAERDPAIKASFIGLAQKERRTLEKATKELNELKERSTGQKGQRQN